MEYNYNRKREIVLWRNCLYCA